MDIVYIVLAIIFMGVMFVGVFVLGVLLMKHVYRDAQQEARYDALSLEYYRMAGVKTIADPRPYVPPRPVTPRRRTMLPGMNALDRLIHEGKRGTIMWRAGDRKKAD